MRVLLFYIMLISQSFALEFHADEDKIALTGDIAPDDHIAFREFITDHEKITIITIESRGGDVFSAMQIAHIIRKKALNTSLSGDCLSACVLMFIGGKDRDLGEGRLGFHRVTSAETNAPIALDEPLYNRLTIFAWGKGVNPILLLQWMTFANPNEIYYPTRPELCTAGVLKPCEYQLR